MKKFLALFLVVLLSVTCMAGCTTGSGESDEASHLDVVLLLYMEGMDPAVKWNGWNLTRVGVGENLVRVNENMEFEPQIAESYEQIDELTYKFKIRKDIKFSNGNPVTPEAIKASIERSVAKNERGGSLKLDTIEIDGNDLIFKTTEPFSAFIANITEPMFSIIDTTVDEALNATMPVSTGPYSITEYVSEERIELAKNEFYWDGVPEIDTITVKNINADVKVDAMLSDDVDVAQGPSATTLSKLDGNQEGIEIVQALGTRENDMLLNAAEGSILADKNLRKALSYGLDRDVVADIAGNGYASALNKPFPESVGYGFDQVEGQEYNVDKAKAALKDAGYEDKDGNGIVEKDGKELELSIVASSKGSTGLIEVMQDMWKKIGINITIRMVENVADVRSSGDYEILTSPGWQTVNAGDGQKYLTERWHSNGTDNDGKYNSPEFDAVMAELDGAFDTESRLKAFVKAQQILVEDVPVIFTYANDNITLVDSKEVENVTVFPIDYYLIRNDWKLVK